MRVSAIHACMTFMGFVSSRGARFCAGGLGAVDMAMFAKANEPFLRGFLELKNGLPCRDTFSRLSRNLDPDQFRASLQRFPAQFSGPYQGMVAIDGKV